MPAAAPSFPSSQPQLRHRGWPCRPRRLVLAAKPLPWRSLIALEGSGADLCEEKEKEAYIYTTIMRPLSIFPLLLAAAALATTSLLAFLFWSPPSAKALTSSWTRWVGPAGAVGDCGLGLPGVSIDSLSRSVVKRPYSHCGKGLFTKSQGPNCQMSVFSELEPDPGRWGNVLSEYWAPRVVAEVSQARQEV